jgi:hypothetical protein
MSLTTGRSEKRTPVDLALVLSSLSERPFKERAFTENVSSHGLRTISKRMWTPGARLLVNFDAGPIPGAARVVYCQRLASKKFAVGSRYRAGCSNRTIDSPKTECAAFHFLF